VIDLVEGVPIWGVPGLEVDSFVHEVRTFDRHLPVCGKVDQSEAIFICTLVQAVLAYCWLMCGFPAHVCVRVSHHQLHVMTWAGCVCPLQLFIKLILGQLMRNLLKNLPFLLITQRCSLIGVMLITMWLNFESTRKAVPYS
jgi:hypothetical protein